jgi:hypothetical protein
VHPTEEGWTGSLQVTKRRRKKKLEREGRREGDRRADSKPSSHTTFPVYKEFSMNNIVIHNICEGRGYKATY